MKNEVEVTVYTKIPPVEVNEDFKYRGRPDGNYLDAGDLFSNSDGRVLPHHTGE